MEGVVAKELKVEVSDECVWSRGLVYLPFRLRGSPSSWPMVYTDLSTSEVTTSLQLFAQDLPGLQKPTVGYS